MIAYAVLTKLKDGTYTLQVSTQQYGWQIDTVESQDLSNL
jgi:hypothetical protein